ncbi:Lrp/AsnC family transcriptional regulator, partial [Pantoea ananatis]
MPLDKTEVKILSILQDDARMTNQELADKIGMSASPCWRKVRKLEEQGVIKGYRAVLDRKKTGSGVMVFIRVVIDCHSEAEAEKFEQQVTAL